MQHDVVLVGAGVAGLQCARRLHASGARVLVLDRSGKVGGRCATRHFGQPQPSAPSSADYGPLFFHGSDPDFLAALQAVSGAEPLEDWPQRVRGGGQPCQPASFAPGEHRLAFREGLNAFPQALAAGLEIRLNTRIVSLHAERGAIGLQSEAGEGFRCREVVLALALEQAQPLLRMLPAGEERDGAVSLLGLFASLPCLTVITGYGDRRRTPDWDVMYPQGHLALLLIGNESSKRPDVGELCLVCQATPAWSRARLDQPRERWSGELLREAAALLGTWAAEPRWIHAHRWRYARLGPADQLAAALRLTGPWGGLGLAGDLFAPGGGAQAAWLSGDRLARRILAEPLP